MSVSGSPFSLKGMLPLYTLVPACFMNYFQYLYRGTLFKPGGLLCVGHFVFLVLLIFFLLCIFASFKIFCRVSCVKLIPSSCFYLN